MTALVTHCKGTSGKKEKGTQVCMIRMQVVVIDEPSSC